MPPRLKGSVRPGQIILVSRIEILFCQWRELCWLRRFSIRSAGAVHKGRPARLPNTRGSFCICLQEWRAKANQITQRRASPRVIFTAHPRGLALPARRSCSKRFLARRMLGMTPPSVGLKETRRFQRVAGSHTCAFVSRKSTDSFLRQRVRVPILRAQKRQF